MTPATQEAAGGETKVSLGKTLRQLGRVTRAFFASERRARARSMLGLLVALTVASVGITVLSSYAGRDVMTSIAKREEGTYWAAMGRYLAIFVVAVFIDVFARWAEQRLALMWREWMAQHLVKRYFNNRAYYRLRGSASIDNPDERISEDVRNFTVDSLSYALIVLSSVMTLVGFLGVLWAISGALVGVALLYAVVGTVACFFLGRRLVGLHYDRYQKEADFRYGLVRVRDNAESIAFFRGEKREHLDLVNRLASVVANMRLIIVWNRNLGFFRNGYNYLALLLPIALVAPLFMSHKIEFGVVTQSLEAFAQVLGAVSLIANNFEGLSSYLAGVQRLAVLSDDLDDFDADEQRVAAENLQQLEPAGTKVKLENLTVLTPDRSKTLVKDLSFELHPRQSLIITGASGAGKSSVLRTIAGLWPSGPGSLERPALNHLMFLPQRPYMVQGTLREQLCYPYPDRGVADEAIHEVVEQVNLSGVLERVDGDLTRVIDWTNILSLGEQQRVSFARLILKNPAVAFLDEATSALDEDNERLLYELIRSRGIGFVSVGHRSTLIPFHDSVLIIGKDGQWSVKPTLDLPVPGA